MFKYNLTIHSRTSGEETFSRCQYEVLRNGDLAVHSEDGTFHLFLKKDIESVDFHMPSL